MLRLRVGDSNLKWGKETKEKKLKPLQEFLNERLGIDYNQPSVCYFHVILKG